MIDAVPRIVSPFGLTAMTSPGKPASRIFRKIWKLSFSGLADAPMTAIREGRNKGCKEGAIFHL
jgi:hypothetical protein